MQILASLTSRFSKALTGWVDEPEKFASLVSAARDARHGDYQANIAMPLGKVLGKPPREVAEELLGRLELDDLCDPPEIAGPGFINLRLKTSFLADAVSAIVTDDRLTVGKVEPRTYIIDYSSPNVAKPMHVGHIRSTVIGDALARILRFLGHKVITDNHLGDWGTQFGMIIYGYKHFVDEAAFDKEPVTELSRIYRLIQTVIGYQSALVQIDAAKQRVQTAQEKEATLKSDAETPKKKLKAAAKDVRSALDNLAGIESKIAAVDSDGDLKAIADEHQDLEKRAQLETVKLHEGDDTNLGLWKKFLPISIAEIDGVYERLDIKFDYTHGESFYHAMLGGVVEGLLERGVAKEDEGAICVFLPDFDAPMIIRKRDGAYLYATTDLATIDYRMEHFDPDAMLYVVDHRQGEHFQKLFVAARIMGCEDVELQHISFGTVLGSDGRPFKTRSGSVVGLEYLLDEAVERAHQVVCDEERLERAGIQLSDEEKREIANAVGLGAIKYADLSHNRTSDYKFDIDEMVQLEGDTAAYIQYMYARSRSILRKSEVDEAELVARQPKVHLEAAAEKTLAMHLLQFEDVLLQSTEEYYPSIVAGYLYSVAKQFASFFDQCPVIAAESEAVRESRLLLCIAVGRTLRQGLAVLGISTVERM